MPNPKSSRNRWQIIQIAGVVLVSVMVAVFIYLLATQTGYVPASLLTYMYIAILIIGGYFVIRIVSRIIVKYGETELKTTHVSALKNLFQIVSVLTLAVAILFILGINITSALVGAGFLGIVLGLAAQTVLSNVFAGLALLSAKEFRVGDRITVNIGQYGFAPQSYPHDDLIPGYTGTVVDVGLTHTKLRGDNNVPMTYPNSILVQSMIFNHSEVKNRAVSVRVDVNRDVPINEFRDSIFKALKNHPLIDSSYSMNINPVTVSGDKYSVSITAWMKGSEEEPGKAVLIGKAIEVAKELRRKAGSETYKAFPIRIGDQVRIKGEFGTVEDVTARYTIIKTWDNRRQVIPNSVLDDEVFINYTLNDREKLFPVTFSVPYDTNLEQAKQIILEEAKAHPSALKSIEPIFQVLDFSGSAITLRLLFRAEDQSTAFGAGCDLRLSIKNRFDKLGIKLSSPTLYIVPDSRIGLESSGEINLRNHKNTPSKSKE